MRFTSVRIENFRAIRQFDARDLTELVVIAGPNGSGKSCVFDALRLLKSTYGGYLQNEHTQWFSEFQLDIAAPGKSLRMTLRDKDKQGVIAATVRLSDQELTFLRENRERLATTRAWSLVLGRQLDDLPGFSPEALQLQYPHQVNSVGQLARDITAKTDAQLAGNSTLSLRVVIDTEGGIAKDANPLAELIFQTFEPDHLGILDFHSAARNYEREALGGLSLDSRLKRQNRRGMALYNASSKYQGVKGEIVNSYLQGLVAKEASTTAISPHNELSATLKELFRTFFPDKSFDGVRPRTDGGVDLPVRIRTGEEHDINELSSGEKEILFGYLRLRNETPHHSIILLDEPELHLNPRLVRGLPDFYYTHLCLPFDNQLWLVTHSDALLQHAVAASRFTVIHMISATVPDGPVNQAVQVSDDSLDGAILALVGDVSGYRPSAKVVVLEGGGDSEFDRTMIQRLFPDFAARVNIISGGSKGRVREIYSVLSKAQGKGALDGRFFAIVDRDFDRFRPFAAPSAVADDVPESGIYSWDVYHIENYLLVPRYIRAALQSLRLADSAPSEARIEELLKDCARLTLDGLVAAELGARVNQQIVAAVSVRCSPTSRSPAADLLPSIEATYRRLEDIRATLADLSRSEAEIRSSLESHLTSGSHLTAFRGRDVLKRLLDRLSPGVSYDAFVSLVVSEMVREGFKPNGMREVLDQILGT